MKIRTLVGAMALAVGAIALPAQAAAAPAPAGYCAGTSSTYPWGEIIWKGKVFDGHEPGILLNRITAVGDILPGQVTRIGPDAFQIDYQHTTGVPVVDRIYNVQGTNLWNGDIYIAGHYAGEFALRCH